MEGIFGEVKIHDDATPDPTGGYASLAARVAILEKQFQLKRLSSSDGKTYFDTENNVIIINDGTYDRVIIGDLG